MNIVYLLIGWSLGLLSPLVLGWIQEQKRKKAIKKSIFVEFEDLKHRLACSIFQVKIRAGKIDKVFLGWIEPIICSYKGPHKNENISTYISKLKNSEEAHLKVLSELRANTNKSLSFKKYPLYFLNSQINSLTLFIPEFQQTALDILTQLNMLHEDIDNVVHYHKKTFDSSLTPENLKRVKKNLEIGHEDYARRAKVLVDTIDKFTSSY
ncbi:hypothetical protein KAS42_06615 [bacterium]|nr:hypothetical protein [bacterium]